MRAFPEKATKIQKSLQADVSASTVEGVKAHTSLRFDWTEVRSGTNSLEHSMQDAGNFETAGDGTVTFTSVSGLSFSGEVSEARAIVADFPASTNNVTLPLELGFEAE